MKSARRQAADPFRAAKAMMTEAALAMLACDPSRVEKAERALASLRASTIPDMPCGDLHNQANTDETSE